MEAIVLAGGFGKRLAHVINDLPKPMADIHGKPFLEYVMEYLVGQGVNRVILAVGYKREFIQEYFKNEYQGMEIFYSVESNPLGTGGGIKKAFEYANEQEIIILNGDTLFDVDLNSMRDYHISRGADITIASKLMHNFERYGTLDIDDNDGRILSFVEKTPQTSGYINGGVYLINKSSMGLVDKEVFSFEKDFMEDKDLNLDIYAYISNGYFIDIGILEDYLRAKEELPKLILK